MFLVYRYIYWQIFAYISEPPVLSYLSFLAHIKGFSDSLIFNLHVLRIVAYCGVINIVRSYTLNRRYLGRQDSFA